MSRKIFAAASASLALCLTAISPAHAGAYGDELGKCLVVKSSRQDRLDFMTFLFGAMSQHPAAKPYSKMTPAQLEAANRRAIALMERLLMQDCRAQTVAAMKYDGDNAIETAFAVLGKTAMEELMTDPAVAANFSNVDQYLDKPRWEALAAEIRKK
ncbi:MAG: hypothetical protein KF842_13300 [Caulobacter sp.]|nr:hypothetical protein [Caulobacter sp.]